MSTFKHSPTPWSLETQLIHGARADETGFETLVPPVYRGSSTFFPNTAAQQSQVDPLGLDYSYGLHGNPTQYTLANRLAVIEGASHCLLAPSGLSAVHLVALACLGAGDHWLIPNNVYGPVVSLARDLSNSFGIHFDAYDPISIHELEGKLQANTKLVWAEAPGSLTFETPHIEQLVHTVQAHCPNARLAIDNTYSAGIGFKPFEWGFDFSVQALTKYQGGHADVLMGAVLSNNTEAFAQVERKNRIIGLGVSPADCALVLRGLLTLATRFEQQAQNALEVAHALTQRPEVEVVLHPGFDATPGARHFKYYFNWPASLFSFALKPHFSPAQAAQVVDQLKLFHIAYSWGGPESLATVVQIPADRHKALETAMGDESGVARPLGPMIRLAIGLEAAADLIEDLEVSLDSLI